MTVKEIHDLAEKDRIAFKKHTVLRMRQRNISADEVKESLANGKIIEDYPEDRPLPSQLISGYTQQKRPIHTVVAVDREEKMLWIITVYEPNLEEWHEGFERRKKK